MALLKKILLVEDDPDIGLIAKMALENVGGFDVSIADSGYAALELLETEAPDLILMDVMMPVMDGPTALKLIGADARWAKIPVIFLTAKSLEAERRKFLECGAAGVISKPFNPMTLADEIRAIWGACSDP